VVSYKTYPLRQATLVILLLCGCSSPEEQSQEQRRAQNLKAETIHRKHGEHLILLPPHKVTAASYPWDKGTAGNHFKMTKEFFRCKGSSLNPPRVIQQKAETVRHFDCGGSEKHSLPLRNGKEFIYPILLNLMNHIQAKTGKRVVITSGHRCPEHNTYVDPSPDNQYSKHMIGAEVAFYVQGMENNPEKIVECLRDYYKETPKYKGQKEYETFQRYEKDDTNVSTPPWYNKETFIKLFKKHEGRNFDNRHPYPYISVQVRYDEDLREKVIYTWEKAHRHYQRW
jgi:hypothetical protein